MKIFCKILFLVMFFLCSSPKMLLSAKRVDGQLEYETRANINREYEGKDTSSSIKTDLEIEHNFSKYTKGILSISAAKPFQQDFVLYEFPEAYIWSEFTDYLDLGFGRMILPWSSADRVWNLGIVNNRKYFSIFDKDQVGLILGYSAVTLGHFNIALVGSNFYVPERYPSYETKDGRLVARSYVTKKLPQKLMLPSGIEAPFYFTMHPPETEDVIFRSTLGTRLQLQYPNIKLSGFYFYKPENRYRVYSDSHLSMTDEGEKVYVNLYPKFFRHHVFGIDFVGGEERGFVFEFSAVTAIPELQETDVEPDRYIQLAQHKDRNSFLHLGLGQNFKRGNVKLNYLKEISNRPTSRSFLDEPLMWREAFGFHTEGEWMRKWYSLFDIKVSSVTYDVVVELENKYLFSNRFNVSFGLQLISSGSSNAYWADFQEFDAAYTKLSYLF